jgi:polygalacturonase
MKIRILSSLVIFWGVLFCLFLGSCQRSSISSVSELYPDPWLICKSITDSKKDLVFPEKEFIITEFGAKGDSITDCTEPIRLAIEKCNSEGGGKVIVPKGVFLTGAIHLKSNVNLYISEGATLLFSTDKSKYLPVVHTRFEGMECMNYSPFIYAYKQKNIAITGKGTINGQGEVWWSWKGKWEGSVGKMWHEGMPHQGDDNAVLTKMVEQNISLEQRVFGEGHYLRPSFVQPYECENVLIEGITLVGSPMWVIHPVLTNNIVVKDIKIESLGPNNDGCDPECCKNVIIEGCYFNTGDDCIAIKSGRNNDGTRIGKASENIVIRNCTMVEGHGGVVIGSEISGNVKNVFAEDCVMDSPNLDRAVRIKSNSLRGGIIEHLYVRNIEVKQVKEAILRINLSYGSESGNNLPVVRNVSLDNVNGYSSKYAVWIDAFEEMPVENIKISNCTFSNIEKDNSIENVKALTFENVLINNKNID